MVKYALLGMLREQPDHGYRLKKRFEERMGSLWRLNTGHVYQTLRALTKAGLVAEVRDDDEGPERDGFRPRRVFTLTARGERTLERWLQRAPVRARPARDETLLRLLLLAPDRHGHAAQQIEKLTHLYRQLAARLVAEKRKIPSRPTGAALVRQIGIEAALLHTEAHIRWLEFTQERLRTDDPPP